MGAYRSTPVVEKESEDKETELLRYGSSSMQGWRITQEDAHNCCPDFDKETNTSLFAVYDGHGGAEVAQYTASHLPDFVKSLRVYNEGKIAQALEESFLAFDNTLKEDDVVRELREIAGISNQTDGEEGDEEENEVASLYKEADMPIELLLEKYAGGGAVVTAPQQPRSKVLKLGSFQSPMIRPKTDTENENGERGAGDASTELTPPEDVEVKVNLQDKLVNGHYEGECHSNSSQENQSSADKSDCQKTDLVDSPQSQRNEIPQTANSSSEVCDSKDKPVEDPQQSSVVMEKNDINRNQVQSSSCSSNSTTDSTKEASKPGSSFKPASSSSEPGGSSSEPGGSSSEPGGSSSQPGGSSSQQGGSSSEPGGSSSEPGGSCLGAASSASGSKPTGDEDEAGGFPSAGSSSGVREMEPQPGSSSGRTKKSGTILDEEDDSESDSVSSPEQNWEGSSEENSSSPVSSGSSEEEDDEEEEEDEEGGFMGGQGEPGSDSGCTAVVALLHGRELHVANAGDSRCVLCRGGKVLDMSVDHKPEDAMERNRIMRAGGRVTADGRVNGGLNLSRAIGDHCYKKNEELSDREQMITALPDIRSISLEEQDEFMVLACDGVWNVMSSQDVVSFVRERLQNGMTKLSAICDEIFDYCLAPDTTGDGTGCDNMTCIIVTFKKRLLELASSANHKRPASEEVDDDDSTDNAKRQKSVDG